MAMLQQPSRLENALLTVLSLLVFEYREAYWLETASANLSVPSKRYHYLPSSGLPGARASGLYSTWLLGVGIVVSMVSDSKTCGLPNDALLQFSRGRPK